jgi:hypothetical protein
MACSVTKILEKDFKSFLDLEIALETRGTPQALRYFWKIFDVDKRGYLTGYEINLFFKVLNVVR